MAETRLEIVASVRDQMTRTVRTIQNGFRGFFDRTLQGFRNLGRQLFSVRGALASVFAYLGGRAIVNHTREIATTTAQYDLWAQKLGTTVGELDRLSYAAEQNGLSFDVIVEGLKTLQERLDDAQRGTRTQAEQFERLGISTLDANGGLKNAVDLIDELAAAYQRFQREGRTEELVLITEDLIGGSENLLSVLLSKGPEAIAKWKQLAEELGIVSDRQAQAAVGVRNAFADLDRAVAGVKRQFLATFGADIIATLRTIARVIAENRDAIVALVAQVIALVVSAVARVVQFIVEVARKIREVFDLVSAWIPGARDGMSSFSEGANGAAERVRMLREELEGLRRTQTLEPENQPVRQRIQQVQEELALQTALAAALAQSEGSADGFLDTVGKLVERFRELYGETRQQALSDLDGVGLLPKPAEVEATTSAFEKYFATIGRGFKSWVDGLKDLTQQAQDGVQQLTGAIDSQLTGALVDAINRTRSWKDAFREAARAILLEIERLIARFIVLQFLQAAIGGAIGGLVGGGGGGGGDAAADAGFRKPGGGANLGAWSAGGGGGQFLGSSFGGGGGGASEAHVAITINAVDGPSVRRVLEQQKEAIKQIVMDGVRRQPSFRRLVQG
jgi:hypothetical protein